MEGGEATLYNWAPMVFRLFTKMFEELDGLPEARGNIRLARSAWAKMRMPEPGVPILGMEWAALQFVTQCAIYHMGHTLGGDEYAYLEEVIGYGMRGM